MALNFPLNPTPGQVYTDPATGLTYVWNNTIGAFEPAEQPPVIVSETQPTTSVAGRLWYKPSKKEFKIYDGTVWITPGIINPIIISDTAPTQRPNTQALQNGDLWWDNVGGVLYVYYQDGDSNQWVSSTPTPGIADVPAGTALDPGISFEGDENTGIFSAGDGNVSITSNGVHTVSIDGSGIAAVNSTGSWKIPTGTLGQRPSPPAIGMIRYNTTYNIYEGYNGSTWDPLTGPGRTVTSVTPPTTPPPVNGDLWFNEETGGLFMYYTDVDTSQWIQVGGTDLVDGILPVTSGGTGATDAATARTNLGAVAKAGDTFTGNVGIGGSPSYPLDVTATSAIKIPVGTDAERPTAVPGLIRYNTTSGTFEGRDASSWRSFVESGDSASTLNFTQLGTGAVTRTVDSKLKDLVSVKDFGAAGDGTTNDTAAVQAAIDSLANGGVVYFPPGTYRIARNTGTNDRWGIKLTASNITLLGYGATLRRFNTDISTYALAYPILLIGTPDSNAASATQNVEIIGLTFTGENTRHSTDGSALSDGRYAIALKNTVNTIISDCRFDAIDSGAIFTQAPYTYDYANSAYFNTTKNYRLRIKGCLFNATPHATNGRALMHAVNLSGVDDAIVSNNHFFWCDNAVIGTGTYDAPTNTENNTWTPGGGWSLGAIKRTGRNWVITSNVVRNSSEHAFYPEGMDVTITGNNIVCDSTTICSYDQIKIRSRVCNVTGNTISNCVYGVTVSQPSFDVSISGNTINSIGGEGGVISIDGTGLTAYINNRSFLGGNYRPMQNIAITGNVITLQEAAHANNDGSAIRIYTDYTDANFTYQVRNVSIEGNTIQNHRSGVYIIGNLQATILVKGNVFRAKPFTLGSFSTSTSLNTYATLLVSRGGAQSTTTLREVLFTGNYVYGTTYIYATTDGLGAGFEVPWGNQGNRFDYVKYIKTSDVNAFSVYNQFTGNSGIYFLDRTWSGAALNNSLFGGTGSYSELRQTFFWTGTNVRFYTDDSGSFVNLN